MKTKTKKTVGTMTAAIAMTALIGFAAASCNEKKEALQKSSETSVVTNDNGLVSRTFTDMTVSTNGNMVTEYRRDTRTTLDADGNLLSSTTSEYTQSYPVGDEGIAGLSGERLSKSGAEARVEERANDSFMGLKFGEVFEGTNLVADADEPTLLRATFTPKRSLAGFDDYYVYVTPKTHKIVKVYACAKEVIDRGALWRRHYLVEALEKRYQTWAQLRSLRRPVYTFDLGSGRSVTACLAGASRDYETVLVAWDDALLTLAADETEEIRASARKAAAEKRRNRVSEAAEAF